MVRMGNQVGFLFGGDGISFNITIGGLVYSYIIMTLENISI
ncbi:Uncharacterised protein [Chlamydia trachomatis]|nr:Uncharacterised protein [Chlamydia trachomatis]